MTYIAFLAAIVLMVLLPSTGIAASEGAGAFGVAWGTHLREIVGSAGISNCRYVSTSLEVCDAESLPVELPEVVSRQVYFSRQNRVAGIRLGFGGKSTKTYSLMNSVYAYKELRTATQSNYQLLRCHEPKFTFEERYNGRTKRYEVRNYDVLDSAVHPLGKPIWYCDFSRQGTNLTLWIENGNRQSYVVYMEAASSDKAILIAPKF